MFSEFKCGCIMSAFQGLVRVCEDHAPEKAKAPSGKEGRLYGAVNSLYAVPIGVKLPKVVKCYPANGFMPRAWNGR